MKRRTQDVENIEEDLRALDQYISRLRVGYDQYFAGVLKREPYDLRNKVQKIINRYVDSPPRKSGFRFRFNQLNAKYQVYRQLWGRIMRQIEAGTYRPHRFKATLQDETAPPAAPDESSEKQASSGIDKLYGALAAARQKTGESASDLSPEKLARLVRTQTQALRKKHGKGKVRFRVVIENNRAKLKASMSKP